MRILGGIGLVTHQETAVGAAVDAADGGLAHPRHLGSQPNTRTAFRYSNGRTRPLSCATTATQQLTTCAPVLHGCRGLRR
jgi:hypothetical protein